MRVLWARGWAAQQPEELFSLVPTDVLAGTSAHPRAPACFPAGVTVNLLCPRLVCMLSYP